MLPLPSTPAALAFSGYFEVWSLFPCAFITLPVMGLAAYLIAAELSWWKPLTKKIHDTVIQGQNCSLGLHKMFQNEQTST